MYEFSAEYEQWFTEQARRLSDGSVQPRVPTPFERSFPVSNAKLFIDSSSANMAGRFASLATSATFGHTVCDAAILVSLRKPWDPPPWMSPEVESGYLGVKFWDDLAQSISSPTQEPFYRVLERAHVGSIEEAIGRDLREELDERLVRELDPLMKRVRKVLQAGRGGFRMSDFAFKELIAANLTRLIGIRQAYCLATRNDHSYTVVPLTEQMFCGLVVGTKNEHWRDSIQAIVLTA